MTNLLRIKGVSSQNAEILKPTGRYRKGIAYKKCRKLTQEDYRNKRIKKLVCQVLMGV